MKLSKATLNKYAEAASLLSENQSPKWYPSLTKGDIAAVATVLGTRYALPVMNYTINRINESIPQDNTIGDLFGDFAKQQFKNRNISLNPVIKDSYPRAVGTLGKISKEKFLSTPRAYSLWAANPKGQSGLNIRVIRAIADQIENELKSPASYSKLKKLTPEAIQELSKLRGEDRINAIIKNFDLTGNLGFIEAPKNNMFILAHELGHLENAGKIKNMRNTINSIVPNGGNILEELYNSSFAPLTGTLKRVSPKFSKWLNIITNSTQRNMIFNLLGWPAPVYLTAPFALSQTVRDITRKALPFKTTDDAMNFVEEHPMTVAASGFMPQLLNEMSTSIPGYRLTRDFYKHLNSLNPAKLTPELTAQLGGQIKNIGKFRPNLEALKFLGNNIFANFTYATSPIAAAAFAYLNRPRKETENI